MNQSICWGVYRESSHSPARVSDDKLILDAVAQRLRDCRAGTLRMLAPEEVPDAAAQEDPELVFYMCEEEAVLTLFDGLAGPGTAFVNPLAAVYNTMRHTMFRLLAPMDFFPGSFYADTAQPLSTDHGNVWIKRGDYHALTSQDVIFAPGRDEMNRILKRFSDRGIHSALIQKHVPGDLIKFYGVRDAAEDAARWFQWFYHRDQTLAGYRFDPDCLQSFCVLGARRLGLEIFGGDAIVTETGSIFIIDFNAWPSFALYRDAAAQHIADLIAEKLAATAEPQRARIRSAS